MLGSFIEKELVHDLDSVKNKRSASSSVNRANSTKSLTSKLDSHIKNIENERDYFKQEVETMQKLLKAAQHDHQLRSLSTGLTNSSVISQRGSRNSKSRRGSSGAPSRSASPSRILPAKNTSPVRCSVCAAKLSGKGQNLAGSSTSPLRSLISSSDDAKQLRRERDDLQALLDKFERHMSEVSLSDLIKSLAVLL